MAFNGAGLFLINSAGQPVVSGTIITSAAFNALTADVATGLSTAICKDGQTTVTANIPMNSKKFTGLAAGTTSGDSIRYEQWLASVLKLACEFRLTVATGNPVPQGTTSSGTLWCTPYLGNTIALYDGTNWNYRTSAEFSIPVPGVNNKVYDVFCYDNATVPTLELSVWTNDTTRASVLATQNGVYVKTGDATRRYLGTFRTNGAAQITDSPAVRWLWNYYNRVLRPMVVTEATTNWTYTTATVRQANGSAANQIDFVVGVSEDAVEARVYGAASNTNTTAYAAVGVGFDSTTSFSATAAAIGATTGVASALYPLVATQTLFPTAGRHTLTWLEYSTAVGTTTWYGTNGTSVLQTGIHGWVWG